MNVLRMYVKETIFAILFVGIHLLTFLWWYRVMPLVTAGEFQKYQQFIPPVLLLVLCVLLFSFGALFGSRGVYVPMLATLAAPFLFVPQSMIARGLGIGAVLLVLFALHRIYQETNLSLGFSTSKSLRTGLPLYFTALALLITVFFLNHVNEETALSSLLPKPLFNTTLRILAKPLASSFGLPSLDSTKTIDETLDEIVKSQLESEHIAISAIPAKELVKLITTQRNELASNFNLQLTGKEKIEDVFYTAISSRLEDLVGPYRGYIPAASAIAFFFAFKAFTFPLYFVTLISAVFMVKFLLLIGVLRREKQTIDVERIVL
ncbi:MAG: hypothetical protein HY006_03165 [Candidatus Sungbacteria bacterium]|nr:hypothetical protein [Candidatus Sungbacteria bacterium]